MGNFSRDRGLSVAPSNSDHSRGDGKLRRDTREGQDVPAAARNLRHRASAEAMKCSSAYQKPDEPADGERRSTLSELGCPGAILLRVGGELLKSRGHGRLV